MKTFIFSLFLLPASLFFGMDLKERLAHAEPGAFIVIEQGKTYTLLHIHSNYQNAILIEEVSIPSYLKTHKDWRAWVEAGAPGHTSWLLFELDLLEHQVTECYSFTQNSHLPTEEMSVFFKHLFDLDLILLPEDERLCRGATAQPGEVGLSKPWAPPVIRDGERIKEALCDVYKAIWPRHHRSQMAGKKIIIYFDKRSPRFPFPHWVQISDTGFKHKIRAIDSGIALQSPKKGLPRRPPFFIGGAKWRKEGMYLTLEVPLYLHSLKLYAIDLSETPRPSLFLPSMMKRQGTQVQLQVEQKEIEKILTKGHQYLWIVVSEEHQVYAETQHAMLF